MTSRPGHRRRCTSAAVLVAALAVCCQPAAVAGPFRAGAAVVDVTPRNAPPEPPSIVAGGFLEARADRVHDPLFVRALVLDDGGGAAGRAPRDAVRLALVVVDSCMLPQPLVDESKALAAARCGIPADRIMVSATHTHAAPAAMGCLGTRVDAPYAARLPAAIAAAIVAAADRLEPARIGVGAVDDWEHTHNRRWIRRPETRVVDPFGSPTGLAHMHPGHLSKAVIGPSGPVDPQLSVISVRSATGRPLAVLACYGQHYFGSPAVSSDTVGHFCRAVAAALDEPGEGNGRFVCSLAQGPSGDCMWMDYGAPQRRPSVQDYAGALADRAVAALGGIEHRDDVTLAMAQRTLPLEYRVPDEARLAWARPIAAGIVDDVPRNVAEVYAREALILHERRRTTLTLQAIRIGDATIAALPTETYALTGLRLRARSPARLHLTVELANGAEGYIPPPEQHVLGGYTTWPARTAGLEVAAEPRIVAALAEALEEVTGMPAREPADEHGPAALAALERRPVGMWRCEDDEGAAPRNAVAGGAPATLAPGFAWHLPGVGAGTGTGAGEALRPGPFSGPRRINRAVHLAGGEIVLPEPAPRGDCTLVVWVWLGERCGASARSGVVCTGLAAEPLVAAQDDDHTVAFRIGTAEAAHRHAADEWHQLAIVRRDGRVAVHVDGREEADVVGRAADAAMAPVIGRGLQGKVDEIVLFDRALAAADIAALWDASGEAVRRAGGAAAPGVPGGGGTEKPSAGPRSPEETRRGIRVPSGYRVELVAAEPDVLDPVAFDWDAAGRLWVVEMADYPSGMDGAGAAGGRVRVLEDRDGDGRYETSRLFATDLSFPNGIVTWRDGVIVTAAPRILLLRDTDGDGRCDERQTLLEGFLEGNQQLRVNGLRRGLDGTLWCASGGHHAGHGSATEIVSPRLGRRYAIGSHDFRFDPDTGEVWVESGPSQFGRCRDPHGHWFGTQNANPLWHWVIADRYVARNPLLAPERTIRHVLAANSPPVRPAGPPERRYHSFEQAGRFTSACGSTVDTAPALFTGGGLHAFTCEPFHNLVQHNVLVDDGASFSATWPAAEGPSDFFAAADGWCRPVMARIGPDGGLWVADMCRAVIEHPDWLPPGPRAELAPRYRLGDDRGRIWRVVRDSAPPARFPDAIRAAATPEARVALLEGENAWQRDLAQALVVRDEDPDRRRGAIGPLAALARSAARAETRLHALWALEGLAALDDPLVEAALADPHPRVREQALLLAERRTAPAVVARAVALADDPDVKVCLQLALSCGAWTDPGAAAALVRLAERFPDDVLVRSAVGTAVLGHFGPFAAAIARAEPAVRAAYREPLARMTAGRRDRGVLATLLDAALDGAEAGGTTDLDGLLATMQQIGVDPWDVAADGVGPEPPLAAALGRLDGVLGRAADVATDGARSDDDRFAAARLLARTTRSRAAGLRLLAEWLAPQVARERQEAALAAVGRCGAVEVPAVLARSWPALGPASRARALDIWLARPAWTADLLERIAGGEIAPGSLSLPQRERLTRHPDRALAARAVTLLATGPTAGRRDVVARYAPALAGAGDTARGREVFLRACAGCHRRGDVGHDVGPNLATVVDHAPERLLTNILDPDADIQPGYQASTCVLATGEVVGGVVAAESGGSLVMRLADGTSRTIARGEIDELVTSNRSFMPEGLESVVTVGQMRDLLAFLRGPLGAAER